MNAEEWAKDFREYVDGLLLPRDDYKGVMEYIDDALELLKEQDSVDAILVEMMLPNDGILFLNREYITGYGYSKEQDKTVVSVLSESAPVFFPGDQTAKIRNAFNHINKDGR